MKLIHDIVAEERFRSYTALLDLQERLKTARKGLIQDSYLYQEVPEGILEQTNQLCHQITILLDTIKEAASQVKTVPMKDRGYDEVDRGVAGWSSGGGCNSGGCGSQNP
jgi:hypothetical protein